MVIRTLEPDEKWINMKTITSKATRLSRMDQPKNLPNWSKKNFGQKNFGPKKFGPNILL